MKVNLKNHLSSFFGASLGESLGGASPRRHSKLAAGLGGPSRLNRSLSPRSSRALGASERAGGASLGASRHELPPPPPPCKATKIVKHYGLQKIVINQSSPYYAAITIRSAIISPVESSPSASVSSFVSVRSFSVIAIIASLPSLASLFAILVVPVVSFPGYLAPFPSLSVLRFLGAFPSAVIMIKKKKTLVRDRGDVRATGELASLRLLIPSAPGLCV